MTCINKTLIRNLKGKFVFPEIFISQKFNAICMVTSKGSNIISVSKLIRKKNEVRDKPIVQQSLEWGKNSMYK